MICKYCHEKNHLIDNCPNIICKKCNGEFLSSPNNYLTGKGCPYCKNKTELKIFIFNFIYKYDL